MSDISFCIPAYNEAESIGETLRELRMAFPQEEIIVVNDGSTDHTEDIAKAIEGVIVLSHERNRGYGAALKTAMRKASGSIVVWYDADGQHRTEDLKLLIQPVLEGKKDVVIGVRKFRTASTPDRLPGKFILKIVAELITRENVPDLNSGLRCFKAEVIRKYLHLLPNGFSASSTSTLLMMKREYRVGYQAIVTNKRAGKSSVRMFRDGLKTVQLMLRILVLFEAFRFFSLLSLLQVVPGMGYGLYIAFSVQKGFPTSASILIISGIFTFFMGIICDQVTELRKEKFEE